eukprot:TRINITY_DN15996_c0_g1_i9.p1 TRINITY_DN15996_c0_g1~~TRINITY_DN15996_c0_g1_i9.p1  ORF type:complete len:183 (-),score=31.71 TRINITY_DN15996_c0_g1_i9:149-697(-)
MDEGGWAKVDDILRHKQLQKYHVTLAELRYVVEHNDKQRFSLSQEGGIWKIRANQGHSLKDVEVAMVRIQDASEIPCAIHGTTSSAWSIIRDEGLSRMNRQHIHFAIGDCSSSEVVSGMRKSSEVLIHLDVEAALRDGIPLFLSSNKVVLSPGVVGDGKIPPSYFKSVLLASTHKPFDPRFP